MINTTINTCEGVIEYSTCGKGTPILFVHGGHTNSTFTLPYKGIDLAKFQLITPSRPGYGKTPLAKHTTPKETAKLFVALLDCLKIEKVIVYGISAGGWTAIELAALYPERVSSLILASAVSKEWHAKGGKVYKFAKIIFDPKIEWATWGLIRIISVISPNHIAKLFFPEFSTAKKGLLVKNEVLELVWHMKYFRAYSGFVNDLDQCVEVDSLRRITCRTLILHGIYDNSVSVEHAHHSNKEIPNSKLVLLDNSWGHMLWIGQESKSVEKAVLAFINA